MDVDFLDKQINAAASFELFGLSAAL